MKSLLVAYLKLHTKSNQGFTLIELLVVITIIGILSAVAIPSFINQSAKARQSEAKMTLSAIARAQQAYYLENQSFATSLDSLGLGLKPKTSNYAFSLESIDQGTVAIATPVNPTGNIKAFASGVGLVYAAGSNEKATTYILCEATTDGQKLDASAINHSLGQAGAGGGEISCGSQTVAVK